MQYKQGNTASTEAHMSTKAIILPKTQPF